MDLTLAEDMREKVLALQDELLLLPQVDIITIHSFSPGVYERKIVVPPGIVLTGAAHKTAYHVRLEQGTIAVTTDEGVKMMTAPCEFPVPAGHQRAGVSLDEEVIWVDVYDNPDDCTDLPTLEKRLYVVPEFGLADSRTEEQKLMIERRAALVNDKRSQLEFAD
jgi:hypothetical protein